MHIKNLRPNTHLLINYFFGPKLLRAKLLTLSVFTVSFLVTPA